MMFSAYADRTGMRVFEFTLGMVFAATPEEAERLASLHGLWDRHPDGTWGREASEAHAALSVDCQAALRHVRPRLAIHDPAKLAWGARLMQVALERRRQRLAAGNTPDDDGEGGRP